MKSDEVEFYEEYPMNYINKFDETYVNLGKRILSAGDKKGDRTGAGTYSIYGATAEYDLRHGFPLLTSKEMSFKSILVELLWFVSGSTNIRPLVDNGVAIWNKDAIRWANELGVSSDDFGRNLDVHDISDRRLFVEKVKGGAGKMFPCYGRYDYGDLGNVYGHQWRSFGPGGFDQLQRVIDEIRTNPESRRLVVNAWNPEDMWSRVNVALPCCHIMFQFNVNVKLGTIDILFYMRSNDYFLGNPYNVASYAILLIMVAKITGYTPGKVVYMSGDTHIYIPHEDAFMQQCSAQHHPAPMLIIKDRGQTSIDDFVFEDFELMGYKSSPKIPAEMFT